MDVQSNLVSYADKLEKLADEAEAVLGGKYHNEGSIQLLILGYLFDADGIALARKVAALVRAASDLIGPVEPGMNMGQVFLRNEQARAALRKALADIEGEGE